jgi:hypothetical protein
MPLERTQSKDLITCKIVAKCDGVLLDILQSSQLWIHSFCSQDYSVALLRPHHHMWSLMTLTCS